MSAGKMAIANVSQTCGRPQARLAAVALPEITTSPFQHSGDCGHWAPPRGTDAAGHPLVTVGIPKTPGGGGVTECEEVPAAPAAWPACCRRRAPMIAATATATATITTMPAVTATVRVTPGRRVG